MGLHLSHAHRAVLRVSGIRHGLLQGARHSRHSLWAFSRLQAEGQESPHLNISHGWPMRFTHLYDQALALSPRAARVAALLLLHEDSMPSDLKRSLSLALSACAKHVDASDIYGSLDDKDAVAAEQFVAACVEASRRRHRNSSSK